MKLALHTSEVYLILFVINITEILENSSTNTSTTTKLFFQHDYKNIKSIQEHNVNAQNCVLVEVLIALM